MQLIFIRFDDVFEKTPELEKLCSFFTKKGIPICLGVVPGSVTEECRIYLKGLCKKFPKLIEIDQHGVRHIRNNKGEFDISDEKLVKELKWGKKKMSELFSKDFSEVLTVPWHTHNHSLFFLSKKLGYHAISVNKRNDVNAKIFYAVGNFFRKHELLGHHVHSDTQRKNEIPEICPAIDFQENYNDAGKFKSIAKLKQEFINQHSSQDKYCGFLIHPQYVKGPKRFAIIDKIISSVAEYPDIIFVKMGTVLKEN